MNTPTSISFKYEKMKGDLFKRFQRIILIPEIV